MQNAVCSNGKDEGQGLSCHSNTRSCPGCKESACAYGRMQRLGLEMCFLADSAFAGTL